MVMKGWDAPTSSSSATTQLPTVNTSSSYGSFLLLRYFPYLYFYLGKYMNREEEQPTNTFSIFATYPFSICFTPPFFSFLQSICYTSSSIYIPSAMNCFRPRCALNFDYHPIVLFAAPLHSAGSTKMRNCL